MFFRKKSLIKLSPEEYMQELWSDWEKNGNTTSEYFRWKKRLVNLKEMPSYLSGADKVGAMDAQNHSRRKYGGMEHLWRGIIPRPVLMAMTEQNRNKCENIFTSLFPTFSIDSSFAYTPRGDRIILMHAGTTHYLSRLSAFFAKILVGASPSKSEQINMLRDITIHWHYLFTFPDNDWLPKANAHAFIHANLLRACNQFLIAHEYGHVVLDHKGYSSDKLENHSLELEADVFGVRTLFNIMSRGIESEGVIGRPIECYGLLAPIIVLGSFEILESGSSLTHPSGLHRMNSIMEQFDHLLPVDHGWPANHISMVKQNATAISKAFSIWATGEPF